jgi:hypothetical protein
MSNNEPMRNFHDFHKISPEEVEHVGRILDNGIAWGIYEKYKDDNGEETFGTTETFYSFMEAWMEVNHPEIDPLTGKTKAMNRQQARKRERELKKAWERQIKQTGNSFTGNYNDDILITNFTGMIVEFRVLNRFFESLDEKLGKQEYKEIRQGPSWGEIWRAGDGYIQSMSEQEKDDVMDLAHMLYGEFRMWADTEADKLILGKMVNLEILTDTGHLTTTFKDTLQKTAEWFHKSMEELSKDKSTLASIIVEYTRDEDFEDFKKYLAKKSKYEIHEYQEMARVVSKCMLLDIVKAQEGME